MYRGILSAAPILRKSIYPSAFIFSKLPLLIARKHNTLLHYPLDCSSPIPRRCTSFFEEWDEIKPGAITKYSQPIDVEPYIVEDFETDYRSIFLSSLLIQEFGKANIRLTEYGTQILQNLCPSFRAVDLYDYCRQYDFRQCLFDEIFHGPIDIPEQPPIIQELKLTERSGSDKGRIDNILDRYIDFKVYLMWEALYYRSTYMRDVIEEAEITEDSDNSINGELITSDLWRSLKLMYDMGLLVREDVDKLPDPIVYY